MRSCACTLLRSFRELKDRATVQCGTEGRSLRQARHLFQWWRMNGRGRGALGAFRSILTLPGCEQPDTCHKQRSIHEAVVNQFEWTVMARIIFYAKVPHLPANCLSAYAPRDVAHTPPLMRSDVLSVNASFVETATCEGIACSMEG